MKGMIVKSAAGHDKGSWYAVVDYADDFVYIADGKQRKIEKPKKKNVRHICKTGKYIAEEEFINGMTNKKLKRILHEYNYGKGKIPENTTGITEEG